MSDTFRVDVLGLNLRSSAGVKANNKITTLPNGQLVTKILEANADWWQVSTNLHGHNLTGFAAARFLAPVEDSPDSEEDSSAEPASDDRWIAHLQANKPSITRDSVGGRAFPLGEPSRPTRNGTTSAEKAKQLLDIVDWLNSPVHARYERDEHSTFCNIYAYDYAYLAGVYLPRIWWRTDAIKRLNAGEKVPVRYDQTVGELNANSLQEWFEDFSAQFGWKRTFDLNELQESANQGKVCIITGQRTNLGASGHINAVVPEHGAFVAQRQDSHVILPLQSQAGAVNFKYKTFRAWWQGNEFRKFGFWIHE